MKAKSNQGHTILLIVALVSTMTIVLATSSVANPRGADMKVTATVESPRVIAVRVRHDLCPICKVLDPQFQKIVEETSDSVLFVTLDLTSRTSQKQAALLVGALGLNRVWTGDLSKIGSVTFLDGRSKEVISFVQTDDPGEIISTLHKALRASRG